MNRIYHTWEKWECYPAGFYDEQPKQKMDKKEAERKYAEFLADSEVFSAALQRVLSEWPNSCEHYLSNERMNRIAWLGQASACIALGIPNCFRGGFNLLNDAQKLEANTVALRALNQWLVARGEPEMTSLEAAQSKTEVDLY